MAVSGSAYHVLKSRCNSSSVLAAVRGRLALTRVVYVSAINIPRVIPSLSGLTPRLTGSEALNLAAVDPTLKLLLGRQPMSLRDVLAKGISEGRKTFF
jgi:hypothetical protein